MGSNLKSGMFDWNNDMYTLGLTLHASLSCNEPLLIYSYMRQYVGLSHE